MKRFTGLCLVTVLYLLTACSDSTTTAPPTDPITNGVASGTVVLPAGSSLSLATLKVTSSEQEVSVGGTGTYSVNVKNQHDRPALVIASNASGEPVLLGYSSGKGTLDMNVASTATTLSGLLINVLPITPELRAKAITAITAHSEFQALKDAISAAIVKDPTSPLTGAALDDIMAIAATISSDVYASLDLPTTMGVQPMPRPDAKPSGEREQGKYDWRSYITINDDDAHNQPDVYIRNHSMAWYKATVTKDGAALEGSPFLIERNKVYTYHWNNFISGGSNKTLKPGDGILMFDLKVDEELTILDPFMNACISMVGLTGNFDMVKMKSCMDGVSSTFSLIKELSTVGERWSGSNYTTAEYVTELGAAVWQDAPLLAKAIYDCLGKQVDGQAAKSLAEKVGKFVGSKFFGYMMMGVYGADISAAVWSAANAQPGQERGRQKDGRYPSVAVTVAPASQSGEECKPLTFTASYDNKLITGYPTFEWSITGPKTHWVSNTGSTPTLTVGSFPEAGLFTIVCTVTGYDEQYNLQVQGSGKATAQIAACNIPNLLTINPSVTNGRPGKSYSWSVNGGDGFVTPPRYRWTFGDNTPPFESDGKTASHTFATEGTYTVRVEALDMSERDAYRGMPRGYGTATANIRRPDCSGNNGSVSGQWPPGDPFNGLSITYSFTGGMLDSVADIYNFHTRRDYVGLIGSGTMTLSGTFKSEWSPTVRLTISVSAGGVSKDTVIVHDTYTPWTQNFSVSLQIPRGATTGSFTVNAGASYGNGEGRGLSVNGTMKCGD
jgi:hypothetical protein